MLERDPVQSAAKERLVRLFLDESGDHVVSQTAVMYDRYLGLVGVAFMMDRYHRFATDLEEFKRRHLPYDEKNPPVLHRKEICNASGAFTSLSDEEKRREFM